MSDQASLITHLSSPVTDTMRTHYCGLVSAAQLDQTVTLCGWVNTRRDHGGVIFIDLRDREGLVQIVFNPTRPQIFAVAEKRAQRIRDSGDRQGASGASPGW